MAATTTNLKTQVQARINAANGSTSLKDLLLIRKAAEGLGCNETNLDTLTTAALNAMSGITALSDLLVGNRASDLVNAGFKTKVQILTSQTFTVPAGVYRLFILAIGGGGAGGGTSVGLGILSPGAGGSASSQSQIVINVTPGDVLTIVVGAKGLAVVNAAGTSGGTTSILIGSMPVLISTGGSGAYRSPSGVSTTSSIDGTEVRGGVGGGPNDAGAGNASQGGVAQICVANTSSYASLPTFPRSQGGLGASTHGPGGGGGSSAYGPGGDGANGVNNGATANAGNNAPSTSYGAGGGGSSGSNGPTAKGGDGADGIVEIFY